MVGKPANTAPLAAGGGASLEETENHGAQEKLLEDTRAELAELKKARASDQASIVADQVRINELSDQLKTGESECEFAEAAGDGRCSKFDGSASVACGGRSRLRPKWKAWKSIRVGSS